MDKKVAAASILSQPELSPVAGTRGTYVLRSDVLFRATWQGDLPRTWRIPAGFLTDGASVPRPLWWFASPFEPAVTPAAVVHDALYASHAIPRRDADRVFYLLLSRTAPRRAWFMYAAVRLFGGRAWKKSGGFALEEVKK